MTHVALGFLANLLALTAIGAGPSLWLLSGRGRAHVALAVAPVVGLVLVTIVGTMLTLLDLPVSRWSLPVLAGASLAGLLLAVGAIARDRTVLAISNRRHLLLPLAAFVFTGALIIAPQLIGGLQYSILRGNGSDSFSYVAVAGALDHDRFSWLSAADPQALAERHPSYPETRKLKLLEMRWATMMLLAFSSRVVGVDPYEFEYAFSALCLLIAFGPVYVWCRRLIGASALVSALAAIAVCAGFWGQFVLDERADAHQNAIPVLLLLGVLAARVESRDGNPTRWGEHVLIGLVGAALLLIYPEIAPVAALGLASLFAFRAASGTRPRLGGWILSAGVALLAVMPLRGMLANYLVRQVNYATTGANTWHLAYFPWLYSSPLTGLWGFGPLVAGTGSAAFASRLLLVPLAALLSVALAAAIVRAVRLAGENAGLALAATLAVAAMAQAAYLFAHSQWWASGKSVSFGYPFFIISIVGYGWSFLQAHSTGWRRTWHVVAAAGAGAFLVIQAGLAVYRPWLAQRGEEYAGYISSHGEYRAHQWDLGQFERVVAARPGSTVWTDVSNPWVADYLGFVLGWRVHLIELGPSRDRVLTHATRESAGSPEYVVVDDTTGRGDWRIGGRTVIASTPDLTLVRMDTAPVVAAIQNPNGVEGTSDAPFIWMGGGWTVLKVVTATPGCARLRGRFSMGPSRPDLPYRHVTLSTPADPIPIHATIQPGEQEIRFLTVAGLSEVRLQVDEAPTTFLAGDKRPLLLRVDDLRLESLPCSR